MIMNVLKMHCIFVGSYVILSSGKTTAHCSCVQQKHPGQTQEGLTKAAVWQREGAA